jgi:hypothetical protein
MYLQDHFLLYLICERKRFFDMTMFTSTRRTALFGALLAIGLLAGSMAVQPADAARGCRSDPVLVINGAIVDVVSTLQTDASAVQELDYTITVPKGSLLGQIRLTVGIGFPENVTYVFSPTQRWGTMRIAATVVTRPGTAPFSTTVQASSLLAASSASGLSNATVNVALGGQIML